MNKGYAYTTVKKAYVVLNEYFRYLYREELIPKNPLANVEMMKKSNFLSAQSRENLPECETVTIFTPEEIEKFKTEAFRCWSNGERIYQQAAAYILMLNTGLRTGELLGLLNSDIDLENKTLTVRQGVKEVARRNGADFTSGREVKIGKPKSATSKRTVPLNRTAVEMIEDLRKETYFGENTPLVADGKRRIHQTGEFPQTVLPNSQSCRNCAKRAAQPAAHLCHELSEWAKAAGRNDTSTVAPTGG